MNKRLVIYGALAIAASFFLYHQYQTQQQARAIALLKSEKLKKPIDKSFSGNYLAARFATGRDDLNQAAQLYNKAIAASKDESKSILVERALPAAIGGGDIKAALLLAKKMDLKNPTLSSQLAAMLLVVDGFKNNDSKEVASTITLLREDGFGRLLTPLLDVWAKVLLKKNTEALARLDTLSKEYPSVGPLVNIQKALVYEAQKDTKNAEKFYLRSFDENLSMRSAWLIGQFYERNNQPEKAIKTYRQMIKKLPDAGLPQMALLRLEDNKETLPATSPQNVSTGVAAVLYDVASVLYQESSPRLAILYAQMAYYLQPNDPFINMLLGDIYANSQAKENAIRFYQAVPKESDLWVLTQFRLAALHEAMGKIDDAKDLLLSLADDTPFTRQALMEVADIYRRQEDFSKAIPYYNKVLDMLEKPREQDWALFYARAICLERTDKWEAAEQDLLQALKLSPDQPEVLNYLAYSWADHSKNLKKALDMLQRALAAAPQDPYITDSVGWVLFRLDRFDDAVKYLEAAAQGLPDDATVNDHLGDAYWRVGRHLEAEFQWRRALKHVGEKEKKLRAELIKKINNGMPEQKTEK